MLDPESMAPVAVEVRVCSAVVGKAASRLPVEPPHPASSMWRQPHLPACAPELSFRTSRGGGMYI